MNSKNIFRGNNEQSHWDEKHMYSYGHFGETYESFCPTNWEEYTEADQGCTIALVKQNSDAVYRKSFLDIGCAHGGMVWYLKNNIIPEWDVFGSDFSEKMIEENKKRCQNVTWEQRDVLLNPLTNDYGIISCLQTIEHFEEGRNYQFIDNILDHCEYFILATVDTEDDCFGEHISFYKLETMKQKGYDVVWESKLGKVNSPIPGNFHCIIWLLKGKL